MSQWTILLGCFAIAAWVIVMIYALARRARLRRVPPWVWANGRLNEFDEAADSRTTDRWRAGMGILENDTLNADEALATIRRDHADFIKQERLAELGRRRRARQRFWGWLPWSIYRRRIISGLQMEMTWLRDDLRRAQSRANRYRDAALQGRQLTSADIDAIEDGSADAATDNLGHEATMPTDADDVTFDVVFGEEYDQ